MAYASGLPVTQYVNGIPMITSVTYEPSGALGSYTTGINTGGNIITTITPDASLLPRPGRISAARQGLFTPFFDTSAYAYDGAGNIKAMGPDTFSYDARSRLTSASLSGLGSQSFTYDRYGNMLTKGGTTFCVTTCASNRMTGASYDLRGNVTSYSGATYSYDGLDRMISQSGPSSLSYLYDGADERVVKIPPAGSWTYTLRDEANRVASEFAGAVASRDNVFLGNLIVVSHANSAVAGNGPVWTFYSSDHLGTPRLITDLGGNPVESRRYWPFGEEATTSGPFQRLQFASMERDTEGTRYYAHARSHDFGLGRFLSPDVLQGRPEDPQTWNRYAYARNNPLKFVDPDGKAFDTFIDVVSIGYDLFDIGRTVAAGQSVTGTQFLALGADVFGAAIPFVTGAGAAVRAAARADDVADALRLPRALGADAAITLRSSIGKSPFATRLAEGLGQAAQRDVDSLLRQVRAGNLSAGSGSVALGRGFLELRGTHGGRVILRQTSAGVFDIVGKFQAHTKGAKENSRLIKKLIDDYLALAR